MTTPFSDVYLRFKDIIGEQIYDAMDSVQRKSLIRTALVPFLNFVRDVPVDLDVQEFGDALNETELRIISLYMYDTYLDQELVKANKVMNIVTDSFKITGAQDKVNNLKEFKKNNLDKIDSILVTII